MNINYIKLEDCFFIVLCTRKVGISFKIVYFSASQHSFPSVPKQCFDSAVWKTYRICLYVLSVKELCVKSGDVNDNLAWYEKDLSDFELEDVNRSTQEDEEVDEEGNDELFRLPPHPQKIKWINKYSEPVLMDFYISLGSLAKFKMVVSLELFGRFWCFNCCLKAIDVYFHLDPIAGPSDTVQPAQ